MGGGTPLVPVRVLEKLVSAMPLHQNAEITIEANPENITPERVKKWIQLGVNRLSVGIQTFNRKQSQRLTRSKRLFDIHEILNVSQRQLFSFQLI